MYVNSCLGGGGGGAFPLVKSERDLYCVGSALYDGGGEAVGGAEAWDEDE